MRFNDEFQFYLDKTLQKLNDVLESEVRKELTKEYGNHVENLSREQLAKLYIADMNREMKDKNELKSFKEWMKITNEEIEEAFPDTEDDLFDNVVNIQEIKPKQNVSFGEVYGSFIEKQKPHDSFEQLTESDMIPFNYTFGDVVDELQMGTKWRREIWNEKTYIQLIETQFLNQKGDMLVKFSNGKISKYVPSDEDILAEDWLYSEENED